MPSEQYNFQSHDGETLSGRLETPDGDIKAYAVFAHCFTCTKDFVASRSIAGALAKRGIATLRFDFTGLGNSEGDFGNTNFSSNVQDLIAAAKSLDETHQAPKLLIGHSLGGAAILSAAPYIESATAVVTLAAPFDPSHVMHLFEENLACIEAKGEDKVDLFGRPFVVKKQFIDDIRQHNQRAHIAAMRKALLVMHAPTDTTVGIENAKMIYDSALHPKSFISLDGMDHLLMNKEDVDYTANLLSNWAVRYIDKEPKSAKKPENIKGGHSGTVKLYPTGNGPFSYIIDTGAHTLMADEPIDMGGKDTGPAPYDFLLASIGACTAMTLRMYANHKALDVHDISVNLKQERIHAKDCSDCESNDDAYVHEIKRVIQIKGDITDEQKQRMLEIAEKCPVHKTLEGEIKVRSSLG